jgi:hypothetical protein
VLFDGSLLALAFLSVYVIKDVLLRGSLWVLRLHLNRTVFMDLSEAALVTFLFARLDFTFRSPIGRSDVCERGVFGGILSVIGMLPQPTY